MKNLASTLRESANTIADLGACAADFAALDEAILLDAQEQMASHQRAADTYAAWIASAIAHRSRHELGYDGLAQRRGFVSPEALIQSVTGATRVEAAKLVQVGTMMAEAEAAAALALVDVPDGPIDPSAVAEIERASESFGAFPPWQAPIADAVSAGLLSLDGAEAIRKALGTVDGATTHQLLREASEVLVAEAGRLNADQLYKRARQVRDLLDAEGIARREKERKDLRYLKTWQRADGMYGGSWLLDPEDGRMVAAAFENILSPRRGGPRFIDKEEKARAEALLNDPRTTEQIAADALAAMVRLAADADPGTLFGRRRPAVRVVVTEHDLSTRTGLGRIEGHPDPVSVETVERLICDTGVIAVKFDDDGQCVNVGRNQRLFTERQRVGLAIRDGGCRFPDCDRPPSWCEAHHIDPWHRETGKTDIADGILLCRRHHMLLHNNRWEIVRIGNAYLLRPPTTIDATQEPIAMPTKNPMMWAAAKATADRHRAAG